MFTTVVIFVVILGILVFVHELGHFIAARKSGMKVEEFGIGFPPRIWKITKGETVYSLNLIPLGGFVKILGENGEEKENPESFSSKKIWQRAIVLIAGVSMNVALAVIVFIIGFMVGLPQVLDDSVLPSATIENPQVQVQEVAQNSAAQLIGLEPGDVLVTIDGVSITRFEELQNTIATYESDSLELVYQRGLDTMRAEVSPTPLEGISENPVLGVSVLETGVVSYPFFQAIWKGIQATFVMLWQILSLFALLIFNLVTTGTLLVDLSGPVGIAVMTGQVVDLGFAYVLHFIALLSLNLAIINIIPFPALDGGKLLFLLIEKLKGKPINQQVENVVHNVGFLILILLIMVVTYRDIIRFGGSILDAVKNIF